MAWPLVLGLFAHSVSVSVRPWAAVSVSHAYPLEAAHLAFRAIAQRRAVGKVVLLPGERGPAAAAKL